MFGGRAWPFGKGRMPRFPWGLVLERDSSKHAQAGHALFLREQADIPHNNTHTHTHTCYSKILQKSGFQIITWFSEEKPGFQKASGKYGFCTAFIRVLYGFCTGFKKQNQILQPKTRFSTSGRCKTWFLLPTPSFCRFFEYQVHLYTYLPRNLLWEPGFLVPSACSRDFVLRSSKLHCGAGEALQLHGTRQDVFRGRAVHD